MPFTHIRFRVLHILFQALMNAYLPKHGIWQTICKVGFYLKTPKYIFFLIPGFDNTNDITLCKCHILQDWGMKPVLNCFFCWWIIWRLSLRVQWTLFSEHCSPFPSSKSKRLVNTHYISDTISTFIANHHQGKLEMCKIVSAFIGRFFTSAISW